MPHRNLDVLDAANRAAELLNALIDRAPRGRLLHVQQMRDSVQSISATISEGFGRGGGRDRARPLAIARGETEETIQHLRANFRTNRIAPRDYWPLHNLLVVIVKMLNQCCGYEPRSAAPSARSARPLGVRGVWEFAPSGSPRSLGVRAVSLFVTDGVRLGLLWPVAPDRSPLVARALQ
jgi:four helix bundle protein